MSYVAIEQSGAGTTHIAAGVANQKVRLHSLAGNLSAAGTVKIADTDGTSRFGAMNVGTAGGTILNPNPEGWCESAVGKGLDLISTTGNFNGGAVYFYVPG